MHPTFSKAIRSLLRHRNSVIPTSFSLNLALTQQAALPRSVADTGTAVALLYRRVYLPGRQCINTALTTQSSVSWDTTFVNRGIWPADIADLNPVNRHILLCCLSEIQVAMQHSNRLFSRPSTFWRNIITSMRWTSCAFHKVVRWHFSGMVYKCTDILSNLFRIRLPRVIKIGSFLTELFKK